MGTPDTDRNTRRTIGTTTPTPPTLDRPVTATTPTARRKLGASLVTRTSGLEPTKPGTKDGTTKTAQATLPSPQRQTGQAVL